MAMSAASIADAPEGARPWDLLADAAIRSTASASSHGRIGLVWSRVAAHSAVVDKRRRLR
jgi:hypothetical protein